MQSRRPAKALGTFVTASALVTVPMAGAQAYNPTGGSADGETLPIYKSDDYDTSWQPLSEVKAPAYLSSDPKYAKYTSNWTNAYLYVLPQSVGNLKAGTLLLASVVSGDDYYKEHKAADPSASPRAAGSAAARARSAGTSPPATRTSRWIPSGSRT